MPDPVHLTDHERPVLALISPAQEAFLRWCREKMPYGTVITFVRAGEPRRGDRPMESVEWNGEREGK